MSICHSFIFFTAFVSVFLLFYISLLSILYHYGLHFMLTTLFPYIFSASSWVLAKIWTIYKRTLGVAWHKVRKHNPYAQAIVLEVSPGFDSYPQNLSNMSRTLLSNYVKRLLNKGCKCCKNFASQQFIQIELMNVFDKSETFLTFPAVLLDQKTSLLHCVPSMNPVEIWG